MRTSPSSAHLCRCAGARRELLEAARADHDAVLIGADDGIAAERARVMAPKALGPPSVKRLEWSVNRPARDALALSRPDSTKIAPIGSFYGLDSDAPAIIVPTGTNMQTITDSKSLGLLIRKERKAQRLTQEQLAALTGVGVRFVRELEAGKESCQIGLALQVAASLGLSISVGSRGESAA